VTKVRFSIPATTKRLAWRVATRPGKGALEVIDPEDWNLLTTEQQSTYQSVNLFRTEQEADKFATGQVDAAKPIRPKLRARLASYRAWGRSQPRL